MGIGPAGGAGVLHTPGSAGDTPFEPTFTVDMELTPTVEGMGGP
jgi:hypothetical protein